MKNTRILALLLALHMVLAALTLPAGASGTAPTLEITNPDAGVQTLSLYGLPAGCYGIQITLELDRQADHAAFVFADTLPDAGAYYTCQSEGWDMTLYLTAKAGFDQGPLVLGDLSCDGAFQIAAASNLKLLTSIGGNIENAFYEMITLEKPAQDIPSNPGNPGNPGDSGNPGNSNGFGNSGTSGAMPDETTDIPASVVPAPGVTTVPTAVPFFDVKPSDWFYDAVEYVYTRSLMTGTSETAFSPDVISSRGMIVTILYRLEGEPDAYALSFDDVAPGQWYTDAVSWCAANGIVNGYGDGRFAPDDTITREQMAAILYRYAGYKGYDVTARTDLSSFADVERVSPYALEAMQWAVAEKLIQGISGETGMTLSPSGNAVRSQSATILMRFCENIR